MKIKLNWDLETTAERKAYVEEYLRINAGRLTNANLESLSNYILWSIDNPNFTIESNSPWSDKGAHLTSLDAILDRTATEGGISIETLMESRSTSSKSRRYSLSRPEVAARLGYLVEPFDLADFYLNHQLYGFRSEAIVALWVRIDLLEYKVQVWEMRNNIRRPDLPIRYELEERIDAAATLKGEDPLEFRLNLIDSIDLWTRGQYVYSKRLLVDERKAQYGILDSISPPLLHRKRAGGDGCYEIEIEGLVGPLSLPILPFSDREVLFHQVRPIVFEEEFQERLVEILRRKDELEAEVERKVEAEVAIDLRKVETIRRLFFEVDLMNLSTELEGVDFLREYLEFLVEDAELAPELKRILELRIEGVTNGEISRIIGEEFGISYRENYISTIVSKRILKPVADAAIRHERLIEFISMGETVFKQCSECKALLPRNKDYFNQRQSMSDGFWSACKTCRAKRRRR